MVELLSRLNPADLTTVLIVLAALIVVGVVGVTAQVIRAIHRHRERETAAAVVAEMLDRNIAPQEIIAVLKAMGLEGTAEKRESGEEQRPPMSPIECMRQMRAKFGIR